MNNLYPLLFGLIVSISGFLIPSMLSMTAVRITLERDRLSAIQFSSAASLVVFIQTLIAAFFVRFLTNNPHIIINLKKASIFILLGLAIFFFIQARKMTTIKGKNKRGNCFLIGLGMSSLNQLAIPYYLVMATLAETKGWLLFNSISIILYALGTLVGSFMMFYIYVCFAEVISRRNQFITNNINYILSAFFIILSSITSIKLFI